MCYNFRMLRTNSLLFACFLLVACGSGASSDTSSDAAVAGSAQPAAAFTGDAGVLSWQSEHDVESTVQRLRDSLIARGYNVFGTIMHDEDAANVDITLRPTRLVIFGNPKAGSPLMEAEQVMGLDLPMKFLVAKGEDRKVRVFTNDPAYIVARHKAEGLSDNVAAMQASLDKIAKSATAAGPLDLPTPGAAPSPTGNE